MTEDCLAEIHCKWVGILALNKCHVNWQTGFPFKIFLNIVFTFGKLCFSTFIVFHGKIAIKYTIIIIWKAKTKFKVLSNVKKWQISSIKIKISNQEKNYM